MSTTVEVRKEYIILTFVIMAVFFVSALIINSKKAESLRNECALVTYEATLEDVVIQMQRIRGECFITTKNGKIGLQSSQNYDYTNEYIHNNIFIGDSLLKNTNSDTIHVYSEKRGCRYFVHKQTINRPVKK